MQTPMSLLKLRFLTWAGLVLITAVTLWFSLPKPDIWKAVEQGDEQQVRYLLTFGTDPNTANKDGYTLLMMAVSEGHFPIVRLLVERGANVNAEEFLFRSTALLQSSRIDNLQMVRYLLEKGANPNDQDNEIQRTPLIHAVVSGDRERVRLLLDFGARIDTREQLGGTALTFADNLDIARLLVIRGADIHAKNGFGYSPLTCRAITGEKDIVKLLIEQGADINTQDGGKRTPLMWAAQGGHDEIVRLLIQKGAIINARDKRDNSALSLALERQHLDTAAILRAAGAKPHTPKRRKMSRRPRHPVTGRSLGPFPGN